MKVSLNMVVFVMIVFVCNSVQAKTRDAQTLWEEGRTALKEADYKKALSIGRLLESYGDKRSQIYGHIILTQAYVQTQENDKALRHLMAVDLAKDNNIPDSILCSYHNGFGLYFINVENDSYSALQHFYKGYSAAQKAGHKSMEITLLNNIASIYSLRKDTTGLRYSREALAITNGTKEPSDRFVVLSQHILLLLLSGKPHEALSYCTELENLAKDRLPNFRPTAYGTIGDVRLALKQPDEAIEAFKKTVSLANTGDIDTKEKALVDLVEANIMKGDLPAARSYLKQAQDLITSRKNSLFTQDLILAKIKLLEASGNYKDALETYKHFTVSHDSLYTLEKEQDFQNIKARFDLERNERALATQRDELSRKQSMIYILVAITALALLAGVFIFRMYRRKKTLCELIVRQNTLSMAHERELEQTIDELRHRSVSQKEKRNEELIAKVEHVMNVEKAYKTRNFTKETLATLVGSNRTYLSQAINEHYNMTFTQYVNSFRAREAVRILSLPDDNTPLKTLCSDLGFSSMTTFYAVFRETTGMTPSTYRELVRKQNATATPVPIDE